LFLRLVRLLKDHPAFGTHGSTHGKKQRKHFNAELHLLVLLKYLGSEGNSCSALYLKQGLNIGKGSVMNYLRRAVDVVLSLFHDTVFWPDAEECVKISNQICASNHFP
jgi:hypothetical protein